MLKYTDGVLYILVNITYDSKNGIKGGFHLVITIESAIFWLSVVASVSLLSFLAEKNNKKVYVVLIWILISFIAGFRALNVGRDTSTYAVIIPRPTAIGKKLEIMFVLVNHILYGLTHNVSIVFLFYALVTYGLVLFRLWELRNSVSFSMAFISFFAFCYFQSLNGMRQYVAIAIVFFATRYIYKGKYLQFVVGILLAFTFHKSALLGFICFGSEFVCWQYIEKNKKILLLVMTLAGVAAIPFCVNTMEGYAHYFENKFENTGFKVLELSIIFVFSLFYIYYYKRRQPFLDNNTNYRIRSTQIYYIMATGLWTVGYYYPFMDRISWYFLPFVGVYYGLLIKEKRIYGLSSLALRVAIVSLISYMLFSYIFLNNGPGHHPYYFIWDITNKI